MCIAAACGMFLQGKPALQSMSLTYIAYDVLGLLLVSQLPLEVFTEPWVLLHHLVVGQYGPGVGLGRRGKEYTVLPSDM